MGKLPFLTTMSQCAETMANMGLKYGSAAKQKIWECLQNVVNELKNNVSNPFEMENKETLVNICSGVILLDHSILMAQDLGKKAIKKPRKIIARQSTFSLVARKNTVTVCNRRLLKMKIWLLELSVLHTHSILISLTLHSDMNGCKWCFTTQRHENFLHRWCNGIYLTFARPPLYYFWRIVSKVPASVVQCKTK